MLVRRCAGACQEGRAAAHGYRRVQWCRRGGSRRPLSSHHRPLRALVLIAKRPFAPLAERALGRKGLNSLGEVHFHFAFLLSLPSAADVMSILVLNVFPR